MELNWIKEILAKAITVGVIALGAGLTSGIPIENSWALGMVFAYAVWTKVIVPRMEDILNGDSKTTEMRESKSSFDLF